VLKEAQDFRNLDGLESYAESPLDTTIFVICHKYKAFDARKKVLKSFAKNGLVYKSDKVREYQLSDWIQQYVKSTGYGINSKASMLLAEFLGTDLGRIVKELEKLAILLPAGTTIDETHVELNIGISKDYNVFEFVNAISARNTEKAFKIIQYFEYNPKAADLTVIISNLFKFFSQIMRIHFLPNKSRESVAQAIGVHPFVAGELLQAKNQYDPRKIASAIELLHRFDLKAKGVGNSSMTQGELLKELTYQILH
jgi:DNA polymerase-3 subunit delta